MKTQKTKKTKRLTAVLLVFALVFVGGGVYAAASGVLTFEGVADLNSNVTNELKLEYQYHPYNVVGTGGSTGTLEITPDGQTVNVTANITNPGEEVDFCVYVANTGTVDAKLGSYTLTSPDYTPDELGKFLLVKESSQSVINGVPLEGATIKEGERVAVKYYVEWLDTPEAASHAGESINFSLQIGYTPA